MRKILLAGLAPLALAAAATPAQANPMLELFDQVCVEGGTRAAPADVEAVAARDLPNGARRVLNLLHPEYQHRDFLRLRRAMEGGIAIAPGDVPNQVYRLRGHPNAYLLTPSASDRGLGGQCILVWEGEDYEAAGRAVNQWLGVTGEPAAVVEPVDYGWQNILFADQGLTAAALRGWTALRALPSGTR